MTKQDEIHILKKDYVGLTQTIKAALEIVPDTVKLPSDQLWLQFGRISGILRMGLEIYGNAGKEEKERS